VLGAKDFKETVSSLKRSKTGVRACPACGCVDVSVLTTTGFLTQPIYICNNCGFQNILFLELTLDKDSKEKDDEQQQKNEKD
jgi:predicted RNA-binding Zn-ribbon protein involved in translation (DUF1610 family)